MREWPSRSADMRDVSGRQRTGQKRGKREASEGRCDWQALLKDAPVIADGGKAPGDRPRCHCLGVEAGCCRCRN